MLTFIPFIYFTGWLILHLSSPKMRFGAGAMALLWIDISSFFAICIDMCDLYGQFGCNKDYISLFGVILYCILWTIILYPLMNLDKKDIILPSNDTKPVLFKYICIFMIICMLIHLAITDISDLTHRLSRDVAELYSEKQERDVSTGGQKQYWSWIPNIVASFSVLYNLCWFISITINKQRKIISFPLLLSSAFSMLVGFASGGRAALLWWTITFLTLYFFFKPKLSSRQLHIIRLCLMLFGGIGAIGFAFITMARFDDGANNALLSFIGYAGQPINNFCAFLQHADFAHLYPDRIFPLYQYIVKHQALKLTDYYTFLSNIYPLQMHVFSTLFGELIIDTGVAGLIIFLILYTKITHSISLKNSFPLQDLFLIGILFCIPVRGLFAWPLSSYFESLYILFSIFLYIIFKYSFRYGEKKLL